MSFRQMRTLADMVSEVLIRANLGPQSALTTDLLPVVQGWLREAQRDLWNKHLHLRNRTRQSIQLVTDVTVYDIPDLCDTGSIDRVSCRTVTGDYEWTLTPGIRPNDRSLLSLAAMRGIYQPQIFDITDGQLEVLGKPGTTPGTLIVECYRACAPLIEDTERPSVDDESMVRYAVNELRLYKKISSPEEYAARVVANNQAVMAMASQQGAGENFRIGAGWLDPAEIVSGRDARRPWWYWTRRP